MQSKNDVAEEKKGRHALSVKESVRTFAAAVGTTAVLMLSVCGVFGLYTENAMMTDGAARTASVFGEGVQTEVSRTVQLGGDVFGIRMFSDGVIVVSLTDVYADGEKTCPAKEAGIKPGDYVMRANGQAVSTNAELAEMLSHGGTISLEMRRGDETFFTELTPVRTGDTLRAGMWIRDSAAGLGTVTFYSADGTAFAALGHGICDADTKEVLDMRSGEPANITICGVERGKSGSPGRLRGFFTDAESMGTLLTNEETGIYGTVNAHEPGKTVEIAEREDVRVGAVQLAATIDGGGVQLFDAEIERISTRNDKKTKTLVVHVTDKDLLEQTGGIVQGMSGCPILQDGKLVGAVTHVLLDDPTRGYGILAETMFEDFIAISAE